MNQKLFKLDNTFNKSGIKNRSLFSVCGYTYHLRWNICGLGFWITSNWKFREISLLSSASKSMILIMNYNIFLNVHKYSHMVTEEVCVPNHTQWRENSHWKKVYKYVGVIIYAHMWKCMWEAQNVQSLAVWHLSHGICYLPKSGFKQKCIHHWLSAHRRASAGVYCITVLHKYVNVHPLVHTETMWSSTPSITEEIIQPCTLLMCATVTHNLYFYLHHLTSFKPELEPYICLSVFTLTSSIMLYCIPELTCVVHLHR